MCYPSPTVEYTDYCTTTYAPASFEDMFAVYDSIQTFVESHFVDTSFEWILFHLRSFSESPFFMNSSVHGTFVHHYTCYKFSTVCEAICGSECVL